MTMLREFMKSRFASGGFSTEDTLATLLPLFRQVLQAHEAGQVAPLDGIEQLHVDGTTAWFPDAMRQPVRDRIDLVRKMIAAGRVSLPVTATVGPLPESGGQGPVSSPDILARGARPERPQFVPGYVCWEQLCNHHDPVTDIFCLGQILASVALGLDFDEPDALERFVRHRRNLFSIDADLHPVIARVIVRMTEPDRNQRARELGPLIQTLEHYRHQELQISVDPDEIPGFQSRDLNGKQQILLDRLQTRLFEITRRNRLLNFGSSLQALNLTESSVPLSFDYGNIREDQILVADRRLLQQITEGRKIPLDRYLNFAEALYLPTVLDGIGRQAKKDLAEYGFAQLRLVLCMLGWSNLKVRPCERFTSPLVLVPVNLHKQRGVRDSYVLETASQEAEINPVVRYLFREWYNIELPESVDLQATGIDALFDFMSRAIAASEPAVELQRIDRPPIRVLHRLARRRLERYQRRARLSGRGIRSFLNTDYSYDPANYHPLGIRLFSTLVRNPASNRPAIMQSSPRPRQFMIADEAAAPAGNRSGEPGPGEALGVDDLATGIPRQDTASASKASTDSEPGRTLFEMDRGSDSNPYNWSFDLCSVSLANFRYRKMSLVRDYERLVMEQPRNAAFESVFSLSPRPAATVATAPFVTDRYDVVPCDPTQAQSIAQARNGACYIIQGPPGTGKSQTITNLIADFAARGKRVLFVCEKRAAIDVVFARLRQVGLGPLCCLIHDSQSDKKSFVMDLRDSYESFLQTPLPGEPESIRAGRVDAIRTALAPLNTNADVMRDSTFQAGVPTSELLERAIALRDQIPLLDERQQEQLPSWRAWNDGRAAIDSALAILKRQQADEILAHHPLCNLAPRLTENPSPVTAVREGLQTSRALLEPIADLQSGPGSSLVVGRTIAQWRQLVRYCRSIQPLLSADAMALLNSGSEAARSMRDGQAQLARLQETLADQRAANAAWRERISRRDLPAALDVANVLAKSFLPFLRPAWWRLRSVMNRRYDFASHAIRPGWLTVLNGLQTEYQAVDAVKRCQEDIAARLGWPGPWDELLDLVERLTGDSARFPDWLAKIHQAIIGADRESPIGPWMTRIGQSDKELDALLQQLETFLTDFENRSLDQLRMDLARLAASLHLLPDYLVFLKQLAAVPEEVRLSLQAVDLPPVQIEAAAAVRTLAMIQRERPGFGEFDQAARQSAVRALAAAQQQWLSANSTFVSQQVQRRFLDNLRPTGEHDNRTRREHLDFQKAYAAGRKVLEREFAKQMRYLSIRDLVSGESGLVIRDLKPIWLMSPLSVSDTLPLGEADFDVVIFDEASQITLESAVPSLFRARQAIVVGDEQQLPPTSFFSTRGEEEDDEVTFEEDGEIIAYDLESSSLLNHSARNLPSTLLGWHYRSRDEALISFSNHAFYDGRLLTIPEEKMLRPASETLRADSAEEAVGNVKAFADRPISFHFLNHGVYQKRGNRPEAEYIARLVCQLLKSGDNKTIGVIAFSEAQQAAIESAIDQLAEEDPEFSQLLEAELVREDDGQFAGLLVKNLENIQGDERDIVILSICYGPDRSGRMIMNFGPINQTGGEKRLNVAFSRARYHMAVVSSIRFGAITNTHNVGANCLRSYLRYAEAVSGGDAAGADDVLQSLAGPLDRAASRQQVVPLLQEIARHLTEHDLHADFNIGSSAFRCDLGIRRDGDSQYRLGILVDAGDYYQRNPDTMNRELERPRLLEIFGWNVRHVLTQDWYRDPKRVLADIVAACQPSTDGKPLI